MRTDPMRLASRTGRARNRRPRILMACNQNEPWEPATDSRLDPFEAIGEVASRVARRFWLDE